MKEAVWSSDGLQSLIKSEGEEDISITKILNIILFL